MTKFNEEHLNAFRSIFPNSPKEQGPVGRVPKRYLIELNEYCKSTYPWPDGYDGRQIDREGLRGLCQSESDHMALYAAIMAWGGRNFHNYRLTLDQPSRGQLQALIQALRGSNLNRKEDFKATQTACNAISGLGISFYTKLLYFLRKKPDAYILDQFTAKSAILLFKQKNITLQGSMPSSKTSPDAYEIFCKDIEALATHLSDGWTADRVEQAMFGKGTEWRTYLKQFFDK
jgi:hypothetical protein